MSLSGRCLCEECDWVGPNAEVLKAQHPFDPDEQLWGCPACKSIQLVSACDVETCKRPVSCGTPTPTGYRNTCGDHKP